MGRITDVEHYDGAISFAVPTAIQDLLGRQSMTQVIRLVLIGILNTINFFVLLNMFRWLGVGLILSVSLAFAMATFISYVLNRRWTFGLAANSGGADETARFYLINLGAWAVTVGFIWSADRLLGPLDRVGENLASLAAAALTILPKFYSYREIVFGKAIAAARRTSNIRSS